ncbi:cation diffusion facilitator family transporter [Paludibacterium paludis]|uniref:cation diffusion facilitator family transporter n=1 Tax=Paludibacterium paludis TaxID=1225769 RepID=UPI001676E6B7|nr:cation diffusion facilitator family transporter [Paludibacterium paludis]
MIIVFSILPMSPALSRFTRLNEEQKALAVSLAGTLSLATLGIGIGAAIGSQSILFDGFFTLISTGMTSLGMLVSHLVTRPENERFQFGYSRFEPLINLFNGLVILLVCLYALTTAAMALAGGGHRVDAGIALWYEIPVIVVCALLYRYEAAMAKKLGSSLVDVDAREWLVDGLLSFGIGLGFLAALLMEGSRFERWLPYVDPLLVVVLSLMSLTIPLSVIRANLKEVLFIAPDAMSRNVAEALEVMLPGNGVLGHTASVAKSGRTYFLDINLKIHPDSPLAGVRAQDAFRDALCRRLGLDETTQWLSVCFTTESRWL